MSISCFLFYGIAPFSFKSGTEYFYFYTVEAEFINGIVIKNIIGRQTLANGSYSTYEYDVMNRETRESFYDHTKGRENVLKEINYSIERRNSVISTTTYLDEGLSFNSVEKYNFESNLVEEVGANGSRYIYTYAPGGRLMSESHAGISKLSYQYYPFGNIKSQTSKFDNTGYSETYFEYDKAGNVKEQRVKNNGVGQAESYGF